MFLLRNHVHILIEICQQKNKWLLSKSAFPHTIKMMSNLCLTWSWPLWILMNTVCDIERKPLYYEKKDDLGGICLSDQIQLSPRIVCGTCIFVFWKINPHYLKFVNKFSCKNIQNLFNSIKNGEKMKIQTRPKKFHEVSSWKKRIALCEALL